MKRNPSFQIRWWMGCLALLTVFMSGCHQEPKLNVFLITLDTTRADHIGCYGNQRIQTPHMDRLAAQGIRYNHAYTVVPITLPSHLSMLTGTYPVYHGVRENAGFYVPQQLETLAEILQAQRYETAAFVSAFPLDSQTGIDQGFDLYDDYYPSRQDGTSHPRLSAFYDERPAAETAFAAMKWLDQRDKQPFFMWTHFFDAHQPWTPPSPFRERYPDSPYDAEIASVDAAIGQILAKMEAKGLLDQTLIIVTADHGEGLGEHGELTHALLLYSSTLRVPLIVRDPRAQESGVIEAPVATIDIFTTVLDKLGLEIPEQNQGIVLPKNEAEADPNREILSETLFGRMVYGWSPLKRITAGSQVLIHGPSDRVYHREKDPWELTDLVPTDPEGHQRLRQKHRLLENQSRQGAMERVGVTLSQADMERLASLGYAGSGMAGNEEISDAVDPKRIDPLISMDIFDWQNEARTLAESGSHDLAIPILERALGKDPNNPLVVQALANSHLAIGELDQGLVYLETLLKLAPRQVTTYVLLAKYHRERNQYTEAADLLKQAVDLEPKDMATRILLAYALEDSGKLAEAKFAYEEILALEKGHLLGTNGLATLLYREGAVTQAKALFEEVLNKQPFYAPAHLNLAIAELELGNQTKAIALAERALALKTPYPQALELLKRIRQPKDTP